MVGFAFFIVVIFFQICFIVFIGLFHEIGFFRTGDHSDVFADLDHGISFVGRLGAGAGFSMRLCGSGWLNCAPVA